MGFLFSIGLGVSENHTRKANFADRRGAYLPNVLDADEESSIMIPS